MLKFEYLRDNYSWITDIYYIAYKNLRDKAAVRELLKKLLLIVSVAGVSEEEIQKALELEWNDFEDSVQYSVAALNEMDGIITRNVKDYSSAEMQVWEPAQFLEKTKCWFAYTFDYTQKKVCWTLLFF